jgi:hypothetical protein
MIGPCPHTGPLVYLGEQKQLEGEPSLHLWNCECGSTVAGPKPMVGSVHSAPTLRG